MNSDSAKSTADSDYSKALETLMKECLPPILVEIVDKRPLDPIQYMADSLHNYKKKSDERLKRNTTVYQPRHTQLKPDHQGDSQKEILAHQVYTSGQSYRNVSIVDCEDFEPVNIKTKMHQDCLNTFQHIGDIFDEDDIS